MAVRSLFIATLCWSGLINPAFANEGQQIYATCSACHGTQGEGDASLSAPALAGQFDWYLKRQLQHYASDSRGAHEEDTHGKTMLVFARQIADAKQKDAVVAFISEFKAVSFKGQLSGDIKNGSRYYHAKCGACHGGKAEGNTAFNAPRLSGQQPGYLHRQMDHFKRRIRGYHGQDKFGRQMAMMSKTVSEKELNDIIYYITEQL